MLLTASIFVCAFCCAFVFASEITIVAKVNQTPITSFDVLERTSLLAALMPNFNKYNAEEKSHIALQNLIQEALRHEYIAKTNFKLTESEKALYYKYVVNMLKQRNIANIDAFAKQYHEFIATEILWQGVAEKVFKPNIKISDDMVASVHKANNTFTQPQIRQMLLEKQAEAYSTQAIESIRGVSIVEIL